MEELNILCLVAGLIAGAGFAMAAFSKGGFRNVVFLLVGFFIGTLFVNVPLEGKNSTVVIMAWLTGLLVVVIPTMIQAEKKAEEAAARNRTTPNAGTPAVLENIFRNLPPADKK